MVITIKQEPSLHFIIEFCLHFPAQRTYPGLSKERLPPFDLRLVDSESIRGDMGTGTHVFMSLHVDRVRIDVVIAEIILEVNRFGVVPENGAMKAVGGLFPNGLAWQLRSARSLSMMTCFSASRALFLSSGLIPSIGKSPAFFL